MKQCNYPSTYIVWDLETSGLDARTSHILEIGCMIVKNGVIEDRKRWVLDHKIEIPEEITRINGMTKEIIAAEGKDPAMCIREFLSVVMNCPANLTHNGIKFDIEFLVIEATKVLSLNEVDSSQIRKHLQNGAIDTAAAFKAKNMGLLRMWNETFYQYASRALSVIVKGKYNLGHCCDILGIDRSKIVQHRALGDVELTHEVYKVMLNSN